LSDLSLTNQPYNPTHLTAQYKYQGKAQHTGGLNESLRKIAICSTEQSVRAKTFFED